MTRPMRRTEWWMECTLLEVARVVVDMICRRSQTFLTFTIVTLCILALSQTSATSYSYSICAIMGNALTDPGRFLEKKVGHEVFGYQDPKFPNNKANCAKAQVAHSTLEHVTNTPGGLPHTANPNGYKICKATGHWPNK